MLVMKNIRYFKHMKQAVLLMFIMVFLGGCASLNQNKHTEPKQEVAAQPADEIDNNDPFEAVNRKIFKFNDTLDKAIMRKVARTYSDHVPSPIKTGVRNFFSNLWEPTTMVNALLQGKADKLGSSTSRFILNSTIGLFGVFDVATPLGVEKHREDFGQTLAVWGVGNGPYIMLPFLGPSNVRDTGGLIIRSLTTDIVPTVFDGDELAYAIALRLTDQRAKLLGADETLDLQVDPYLFLRESYRQSRLSAIYDGSPPIEEDEFEAELFAE